MKKRFGKQLFPEALMQLAVEDEIQVVLIDLSKVFTGKDKA